MITTPTPAPQVCYWTSKDGQHSIAMDGCTPEEAWDILIDECGTPEEIAWLMAGSIGEGVA